jgi:hypothetical protein
MPVQGQATSFGDLNVHTQPSRQSPSFMQVKENEKVDVLIHAISLRADVSRKPLLPPAPKKAKTEEKKPAKESKYPPIPLPKPPGPPANWLELSKTDLADDDEVEEPESKPAEKAPQKPVPTDDWSLIRLKTGESGWVLTRRLSMAIPDEVAQYAEGRRIVSYFSLGGVQDGDDKKQNWLWTTISDGAYPYDFDSFRVFIWSLRRHRYETAYIERNIRGYAPVMLRDIALAAPKNKQEEPSTLSYPGFSVCLEKKDGQRYRRDYAFITNVVRFAGEHSCEAAAVPENTAPTPLKVAPEPQPRESFAKLARKRLRTLAHNWFGK